MLGVNLLVRLGRKVLACAVADSGLLPTSYYRHLTLAALEEDDFPGALNYLQWAADPLLAQILVLRLRLLAAKHDRQRQALLNLSLSDFPAGRQESYRDLLAQENRALELLGNYETQALARLSGRPGVEAA
jgi:hypothetical protein